MADKDFGVKRINLVGATGTPTITSPTDLIIKANNVAISTNVSIGGRLGIGTTNPTTTVSIAGTLSFSNNNIRIGDNTTGCSITSGTDNFFAGKGAGRSNTTGCYNNFFGSSAGSFNTTGCYNNFLGNFAGFSNIGGCYNNFLGNFAGRCNTSGSHNNFFGNYAGSKNTSGLDNNFFGNFAGYCNTTGCYNNFFGPSAGSQNTTGRSNNFFGSGAGSFNTSGCSNNFFGGLSGYLNTTGCHNNFLGCCAGYSNAGACNNNFFGNCAGRSNTTGCSNNFFGTSAGIANTSGCYNNFIGIQAGYCNTTGCYNNFLGANAGLCNTTGFSNNFIGLNAGCSNTSGVFNTFIGNYAGKCNISGNSNNFIGYLAGRDNSIGSYNNFFGQCAGLTNIDGSCNNFIGYHAGRFNSSGSNNNFIGFYAGRNNSSGDSNNFFGQFAGTGNNTGSCNNFFGGGAGCSNTSGCNNSFFGQTAGFCSTIGSFNSFFGNCAGAFNINGCYNSFFGRRAGFGNTSGSCNTFFGASAGRCNTTGSCNIFFGNYAASTQTLGNRNVAIGYSVQLPNTTGSDQLAIGFGNSSWISGNSDFNVGIGTTNPTSKLWVNGDGYFVGVVTATTFNGNLTGIASTATNLAGGGEGYLPYQFQLGITSFISGGSNDEVLLYDTVLKRPKWGSVSSGSGAFAGIDVIDEDGPTVTGIKTLNFRGDNISAVSDTTSGISTITVSSNLVGTALSISGISTLGTVKISSGIVTSTTGVAVTFYGDFVGTASSAGYATTAFNLNGVVESNLNVAYASTAGIASAVKPNSVGLGTDTFGDYVRDITGTANQITVTGGTGEGSTPTLSIPNQFTVPQDLTVTRDVQINRNLNVNGNITIGGTSAYILVDTFRVSDADIVLGFRTDAFDNDVSNDNTANHGGIAVASTEGNPLVDLSIFGIETLPSTYKKIMWFKAGAFAGLNTDAWLFNYAVGIGSTQFPAGTRLAAGSVQFTENDLAVVRNINATGIITAIEFSGKLNATSALAQSVGFATTTTNLAGGVQGSLPYQNSSGITSFVSVGTNNQVLLYDTGTNKPYWGNVSSGEGSFAGITVRDEGTTSLSNIVTVDIFGSNITATSGGTGIASIRVSDNLVGTALSISGITTFTNGPVFIGSGTSTGTASQPLQVTGGAYVSGNLGIGTINPNRKLHVQGDIKITGGIYDTNDNSGSSNRVLTANGSGGWSWQPVTSIGAISGVAINNDFSTDASRYLLFTDATSGTVSTEYVSATQLVFNPSSGNLGIGTTVPTEKLQVNGNISINGTTSYGSVTATTATTSQIGIHSTLSISTYRSIEYTIQATQGTNYHVTKILSIHDGTITYNSEYGTIYNNGLVGTFDVDISGGNMRLLVTPASSSSTSYTINFITTKI